MSRTHRQLLGEAGVYFVRFDLARKGIPTIEAPEGEAFDLFAYWGTKPIKIQVRSRTKPDCNKHHHIPMYVFRTSRQHWKDDITRETVIRPYQPEETDAFAFVGMDVQKVSYFRYKDIGTIQSITLRSPSFVYSQQHPSYRGVLGEHDFTPELWSDKDKSNRRLEVLKEFYERLKEGGLENAPIDLRN